MSKKSSKKAAKPLVPGQESNHAGTVYPVEQAELDAQNARLKKAAAAGAGALKSAEAQSSVQPPVSRSLRTAETLNPGVAEPNTEHPLADRGASNGQELAGASTAPKAAPAQTPAPAKAAPQPKPTRRPGKESVAEKAHSPAEAGRVKVNFVLLEPGAKRVSLRGEFNGWSPDATPMKRRDDGHWEASVVLAPGCYEYKFFVDGQWVPDPLARENVWNNHGTLNSVVVV